MLSSEAVSAEAPTTPLRTIQQGRENQLGIIAATHPSPIIAQDSERIRSLAPCSPLRDDDSALASPPASSRGRPAVRPPRQADAAAEARGATAPCATCALARISARNPARRGAVAMVALGVPFAG